MNFSSFLLMNLKTCFLIIVILKDRLSYSLVVLSNNKNKQNKRAKKIIMRITNTLQKPCNFVCLNCMESCPFVCLGLEVEQKMCIDAHVSTMFSSRFINADGFQEFSSRIIWNTSFLPEKFVKLCYFKAFLSYREV